MLFSVPAVVVSVLMSGPVPDWLLLAETMMRKPVAGHRFVTETKGMVVAKQNNSCTK